MLTKRAKGSSVWRDKMVSLFEKKPKARDYYCSGKPRGGTSQRVRSEGLCESEQGRRLFGVPSTCTGTCTGPPPPVPPPPSPPPAPPPPSPPPPPVLLKTTAIMLVLPSGTKRMDIAQGANPSDPAWVSWATIFTLRRSDGATTGDVRWGDTFQILMSDERANQVASFSSEATMSAEMGHESWATRLYIRGASQVVQYGETVGMFTDACCGESEKRLDVGAWTNLGTSEVSDFTVQAVLNPYGR